MKDFIRGSLAHLLPVAIFAVLMLIYFYPVLEGDELVQSDVIQLKGTNHEFALYKEKGERILWTNSSFGGMPIFTSSPKNIYLQLHRAISIIPIPVLVTLLGFIGFYILLQSFRVNIWLSFLGAAAFVFSTFNFISLEAGHVNKVFDIMLMAPVLAGVFQVYRGKIWGGILVLLIFLGMQIFYGHIQVNYYLLFMILGIFLMELVSSVKNKSIIVFIKRSFILAGVAILVLTANIVHLWSTRELAPSTTRGGSELTTGEKSSTGLDYNYAFSWSSGVSETLTLLVPYAYGGSSVEDIGTNSNTYEVLVRNGITRPQAARFVQNLPLYWGNQPSTAGPIYFGAVICFLFLFGFFVIKTPLRWWVLALVLLSVILSWGKNFPLVTDLFYNYFPLYNKFRSVTMILTIAQLLFPFFGILALKEFLEKRDIYVKNLKPLMIPAGVSLGITFILFLFGGSLLSFTSPNDAGMQVPEWLLQAIRDDRLAKFQSDSIRSFFLIFFASGTLWLYIKDKINLSVFYPMMIFIVIADLWFVNKRYLVADDFQDAEKLERQALMQKDSDRIILQDTDPHYRVLNLTANTFNDGITSYFHKSIGGYSAIKMGRYQDVIEEQISRNNIKVLNMLNTKYFILGEGLNIRVQANPAALGNCWFVKEARIVQNADEENEAIKTFDPAATAVIDKRYQDQVASFQFDSAASIRLESYHPMKLVYHSNAQADQLAVFSDIYYQPGWESYVDGSPVDHFRANYILRAMMVPAGEHTVTFEFKPKSYTVGEPVGLVASVFVMLIMGLSAVMLIRTGKISSAQ